jgi:SnoaL-like domain
MSKEELQQLAEQELATWDAHDPDAFVALFADEFVWHDWTLPDPIRSKDAARQFYSSWMTAFPDPEDCKRRPRDRRRRRRDGGRVDGNEYWADAHGRHRDASYE